ncbi:hypothetical protein OC25_07735 [Pedobacter kyungheensis]|uniref:Alpha-L-rhamnosidase six-hairpin glycosidase domain-containing protein n=1 Tax=Pedobacter kyungheensis TaxID=1069985 RepID=A0A0C1FTS3_9SPHI|nr:hypothetical protein [Pedobacter kyungheensis]KIA95198.1 hypothetical protein OC25_07735 [Pedobacter kyungheensis]
MKNKIILLLSILTISGVAKAQNSKRWELKKKENAIYWQVKNKDTHQDHIEMSGLQVSGIITYGTDNNGMLLLNRKLVFPMLRTIPNNTHGSLIREYNDNSLLQISADGKQMHEYPERFTLNGTLSIESRTDGPLKIIRTIFPSTDKAAIIEKIEFKNNSNSAVKLSIENHFPEYRTDSAKGVYGTYLVAASASPITGQLVAPGASFQYQIAFYGRKITDQPYNFHADFEQEKRMAYLKGLQHSLQLVTPNDTINSLFAFSKIRAAESIYDTKNGLMHGPGGGSYYAAIWANDQAEYANPFFPFLGDINGNESAINSFRMFAKYMNPEYKPIPSSIVAEGTSYWNGAGDRGDMAMIAYGASRFALAKGKQDEAKELSSLVKWCLEYLDRKYSPQGVIRSDADELEGRFPAGKINLATNTIAYAAYLSSADLMQALGNNSLATYYREKAKKLRKAINEYFGAKVEGFETYRYYDANEKLRAWICLPLVFGINEREEQTIKALFSDKLWTYNGILTESGDKTFWDRATLYAFRGMFTSGQQDKYMHYFDYYSATRLLGEHVPYPVEAWPEGGQRHLSAESALYCRTITEGLFGITPTGLQRFAIKPAMPAKWAFMELKNICAFDRVFDIVIRRNGKAFQIDIKLQNGKTINRTWNGKEALTINLSDTHEK